MSLTVKKAIVARVSPLGETYYLSNRIGVTLDNEVYEPLIVVAGDAEKLGNFGEGMQRGTCSLRLLHGEKFHQGDFIFNTTLTWNNRRCTLRLCDVGTDTTWAGCEDYYDGIVKNFKIDSGALAFDIDDEDYKETATVPKHTPESLIKAMPRYAGYISSDDVPRKYKGSRIPMQYGDLSDAESGIFGKGVTLSQAPGWQEIVFDHMPASSIEQLGMWHPGTERFFVGLKETNLPDGTTTGEYVINADIPSASFNLEYKSKVGIGGIDTTTGVIPIPVTNRLAINWTTESDVLEATYYPELLCGNIIRIEDELMMVVEKPDTSPVAGNIYVERGYNGTTVAAHGAMTPIYQSGKFGMRNLLSFIERFAVTDLANQTYDCSGATPPDTITSGQWYHTHDGSMYTYIKLETTRARVAGETRLVQVDTVTFDMKFKHISQNGNLTVYMMHPAVKCGAFITRNTANAAGVIVTSSENYLVFLTVSNPSTPGQWANIYYVDLHDVDPTGASYSELVDAWTRVNGTLNPTYAIDGPRFRKDYTADFKPFGLNELTALNKRWLLTAWFQYADDFDYPSPVEYNMTLAMRIYALGFWVAGFVDFTKEIICAPIQGRMGSANVINICSGGNTLVTNPARAVCSILTDEGTYTPGEFDQTVWQAVRGYCATAAAYGGDAIPAVAMSYGVDESNEVMKLAQEVAHQYLLFVSRTDAGKLTLVNLHRLQSNNGDYGYPSMAAYGISIDDILMAGTERRISIQQTGTDRLRNKVEIHYKRNNSTDEYQAVYPSADDTPDAYTLIESGITLAQARINYYGGQDTELLKIEAFAIYTAKDAERLWKWHINDKAEAHYWAEFVVDHEHYNLVNSKASQYAIGDVIYLDGRYGDLALSVSFLWVVRDIIKRDEGRELEIHVKSVKPIASFTSSATGQNPAFQNTVDTGDEFQNTIDTGDEFQHKI